MPVTDDYAELYTLRERLRLMAVGLATFGCCYLFWTYWGLPHWSAFASHAHCSEVFDVPGIKVLFYTLFVGMPLGMALLTALFASRRGLRILRDGQSPYRGEKVFRRTRIKRGSRAKLIGWAQLLAPLWFVAIALWGATAAHGLIADFSDPAACETAVRSDRG